MGESVSGERSVASLAVVLVLLVVVTAVPAAAQSTTTRTDARFEPGDVVRTADENKVYYEGEFGYRDGQALTRIQKGPFEYNGSNWYRVDNGGTTYYARGQGLTHYEKRFDNGTDVAMAESGLAYGPDGFATINSSLHGTIRDATLFRGQFWYLVETRPSLDAQFDDGYYVPGKLLERTDLPEPIDGRFVQNDVVYAPDGAVTYEDGDVSHLGIDLAGKVVDGPLPSDDRHWYRISVAGSELYVAAEDLKQYEQRFRVGDEVRVTAEGEGRGADGLPAVVEPQIEGGVEDAFIHNAQIWYEIDVAPSTPPQYNDTYYVPDRLLGHTTISEQANASITSGAGVTVAGGASVYSDGATTLNDSATGVVSKGPFPYEGREWYLIDTGSEMGSIYAPAQELTVHERRYEQGQQLRVYETGTAWGADGYEEIGRQFNGTVRQRVFYDGQYWYEVEGGGDSAATYWVPSDLLKLDLQFSVFGAR
jgi:hypothetical protein